MRRSFSNPVVPAKYEVFHRNAGSERFRGRGGSGLGRQPPGLLQAAGCFRKLTGLSALGRPCKYNIYKNIEGKADIPPFQCINSDVQK